MEKGKKRRRKLLVVFILAVIMIWIGGCAMNKPINLSSLISIGDKPIVNGSTSEKGPQTDAGTDDSGEVIVVGDTGLKPGTDNGSGKPDKKPNGSTTEKPSPEPSIPPTEKPDSSTTEKPGKPDKSETDKCEKCIALTFDDGPDKRYTTAILDILKEKDVKATFFVVGLQASKYPDVLKRIDDEGHAIGNHTYNHKDLSKQTKETIMDEMLTTDEAIKEAIGYTPTLFRAPYGAVNETVKAIMKDNNREMISWNVDTRDWAGTSSADMLSMIKKKAKPGAVILMHSFGNKHIQNTVKALPGIIKELEDMGYKLVTIDELGYDW